MKHNLNNPLDGNLAKYNGDFWIYLQHSTKWVLLSEADQFMYEISKKSS